MTELPEITYGALVSPDGDATKTRTMSVYEFEQLTNLLAIMREPRVRGWDSLGPALLSRLASTSAPTITPELVVREVMDWFSTHWASEYSASGVYYDSHTHTCEMLTAFESIYLHKFLTVVRREGWFADWVTTIVQNAADADSTAGQHPTPAEAMTTLAIEVAKFEERMEAAREFVRLRPQLLDIAVADTISAAEPSPETSPSSSKKRAGNRRKGMRKAS